MPLPPGKILFVAMRVKQKAVNATVKEDELFSGWQAAMRDSEAFEEGLGGPGA